MARLRTLALAVGILGIATSTAQAEDLEHRVGGHFHVGFGGELETNLGPLRPDADFDATIGIAGRYEARLHRYVALGGLLGFNFWKLNGEDDRQNLIDIDVYVKGIYPLDDAGPSGVELYAMLPLGLTVSVLDDDFASGVDRSAAGWNLAFWMGSTLFLTEQIGVFAELGFWHHAASHDTRTTRDLDGSVTQAALNFGALIRL